MTVTHASEQSWEWTSDSRVFPLYQSFLFTVSIGVWTQPYFCVLTMLSLSHMEWKTPVSDPGTHASTAVLSCHMHAEVGFSDLSSVCMWSTHMSCGPWALSATLPTCSSVVPLLWWLCDESFQLTRLPPWKFQDCFSIGAYGLFGTELPRKLILKMHVPSPSLHLIQNLWVWSQRISLLVNSSDNCMNSKVGETL